MEAGVCGHTVHVLRPVVEELMQDLETALTHHQHMGVKTVMEMQRNLEVATIILVQVK